MRLSRSHLSLLASLSVLLVLQPPALLPLGPLSRHSNAVAAADSVSGDDGACTKTCYAGLVETAKGRCRAHEYDVGLFEMLTDAKTRRAGQSFFGDRSRLVAALQRYRAGGNLTIVTVGGSITAGQGAVDAPPFPKWLQNILLEHLPDKTRVRVHNGAVPGTSSQYMSSCHNVHVPADADIVFVEYAVNDDEMPMPHMNNQVRRPYERLLRKLLNYPNKPAVVLMHAFRWFHIPTEDSGQFWHTGERQQSEFGIYYGLPQVSVKACCYHHMVAGKTGFNVKRPRADLNGRLQVENFVDAMLKGNAFFYDIIHPDGNTGHRVLGELAFQIIMDVWAQVASGYELSPQELDAIKNSTLPPPMLPANYESMTDKCFIGPAFQRTIVHNDGFKWINEGKNPNLPKWGYVALEPEKELKVKINTKASAGSQNEVTVELGYLRSYENMGKAAVQCEGGCSCTPWVLDGLHDQHNSQAFLHEFKVSQAEDCVIAIKVLHETSSGKHKVKITGVMVSEDPDAKAFQNWAAFDWVGSATFRDPNGVFEINNVARRSLLKLHMQSSAALQRQYHGLATVAGGEEGSV